MQENSRNIYKNARRGRGYTQEAAAERLGISVESIRAYETGQRVPPTDVVELMSICYDASYLPAQHLIETNRLAREIIPAIEERSMIEMAVGIFNRVNSFAEKHSLDRLLAIAEDNHVDDAEQSDYDAIMDDLREIFKYWMGLSLYREEKEERP